MRVSRKKATYQSGKKKGKLKPGCRFIKGDGADCKSTKGKLKRKSRRKTKRKGRKRKVTGAARRARKGVAPRTPRMNRLNEWRRAFKRARSCGDKRKALRNIKKQFQHMAARPAKSKRGESQGQASRRRWRRWQSEYRNKLEQTEAFCTGRRTKAVGPMMVNGLSAAQKKKHPCARSNPPAWCKK